MLLAIHGFGAEALLRNEPGLHLLATDAAASAMMTSRASARVAFATVELAARMIKAGLSPRIASAKVLPVGVVASAEMLPAIAPATIASPLLRRGYGHRDDTLGAGRTD
jgi:hypothetical protein